MDVLEGLLIAAAVVALAWVVLVVALWLNRPTRELVPAAIRLVPDLGRLVAALARDPATSRGARLALGGLALWLAMPFDPVPDFLPVVGALDDLVVAVLVLRWVLRRAGRARLRQLWAGSPEGLGLLERLLGLPDTAV